VGTHTTLVQTTPQFCHFIWFSRFLSVWFHPFHACPLVAVVLSDLSIYNLVIRLSLRFQVDICMERILVVKKILDVASLLSFSKCLESVNNIGLECEIGLQEC
jgi:hypothetical protein